MKRLLLILAIYVLASIGVQAQVVGEEDSIKVLWENEVQDKYGNVFIGIRTPIYKSFDKNHLINTLYLANSPFGDNYNHIQKRDIETGELLQEVEVNNPEEFSDLYVSENSDLLVFTKNDSPNNKNRSLKIYFYNQSNFDSLFTIEPSESIIKYQANKYGVQPHYVYEIAYFAVSPDDKKLIFSLRVPNDVAATKYIYDIESRQLIDSIVTEKEMTYYMLFTPDNTKLVLSTIETEGSYNYYVAIYDAKDFSQIRKVHLEPTLYYMKINKNSNLLMLCESVGKISIIDLSDYSIKEIKPNNYKTDSGYITDEEKYMLITYSNQGDDHLGIYNLETDQIERTFSDIEGRNIIYDEDNKKLLCYGATYIGMYDFDLDYLVSVEDKIKTEQILYPNPGSDIINVPINEYTERIEIYDVSGEVVFESLPTKTTQRVASTLSVDISQLPVGTYFVKVYQNDSIIVYKFIKE